MALNDRSKIVVTNIEEEMKTSYIDYSMSVIVSRALPDVRDGLKPSQRRILVAMNDLNLAPGRPYRKCAKIAGDTSGNYHPHGEQVVYPTLVRLAQDWVMRYAVADARGLRADRHRQPSGAVPGRCGRRAAPVLEAARPPGGRPPRGHRPHAAAAGPAPHPARAADRHAPRGLPR